LFSSARRRIAHQINTLIAIECFHIKSTDELCTRIGKVCGFMSLFVGRWYDDLRDKLEKDMEEGCGQAV